MSLYPYAPAACGLTAATFATSEEAAKAIAPNRPHLLLIALQMLDMLGAATRFEAVSASGIMPSALLPRFSELIRLGLAEPTGERRRNPETDKSAAVLCLTDLGRTRLAGGAA
jgi:hypothetical protein